MNIGLQYYYNVVHPDTGPSSQFRIIFALLYPNAHQAGGEEVAGDRRPGARDPFGTGPFQSLLHALHLPSGT